jgi:hypothetical protein
MSFRSSFLVTPSPVSDGPPWGSERLVLEIAGHEYAIDGLSGAQKEALSALYRNFVIPDRSAPPEVRLRRIERESFRHFDRRGWEYALDVDYAEDEVRLAGLDLVASIEWRARLRGTLLTPADGMACHGPVENFLRIFTAYSTLARDGVFLHSAAVRMDGEAVLFVGASGAGKSTIARSAIATGLDVLSDDLNPVTSSVKACVVNGSPFLGDIGSRSILTLPLRAIYRLDKGRHDSVRALSPGEAVASLLACAPFVNHDPHRRDQIVDRLCALVNTVPVYSLTFRREATFWSQIARERVLGHA